MPLYADNVSLTRPPVFDERNRLWGYELFCIGHIDAPKRSKGTDRVAHRVANSA